MVVGMILTPYEIIRREMEEKYSCLVNVGISYPQSKESNLKRSATLTGRHLTEEHKLRISLAHRGKTHSAEHSRKVAEAQKGKVVSPEARERMSLAHIGKKLPEEQKQKIGAKSKEMWADPTKKAEIATAIQNGMDNPEYHEKLSIAQLRRNQDIEEKNKRIEATKAGYTPEVLARMSAFQKERYLSQENRDKTSEVMKQLWQHLTPEEKSRKISKMMSGNGSVKPTVPEQKVKILLDRYCPELFMYTGDGGIIINGLIPDFTDRDGSKKVIEVFGDYWHSFEIVGKTREEEKQSRRDQFAKFGFGCLVIWESELVESKLAETIERIKEFAYGKS